MAKTAEGSPEWFRVRQRATADYIRASDAIGVAASSIKRILHDWQTMDDELKSALFHSAVIHFARPFSYRRDYGGNDLKHRAGFDQELHGHLIDLRNSLVAHHENDVLRAWVGHQNYDLTHNGIRYTALIATGAVVKALHTIREKSVAERYSSHITACMLFFREAAGRELSAIHEMALRFPAAADAGSGVVQVQPVPIERQVMTTQVPSMVNFGSSRIPEPQFPLPLDSYQYRTAAMEFYRTKIEIETPSGTALIELSDRPTTDASPSTDDTDASPC
jgi:hypothetical protein